MCLYVCARARKVRLKLRARVLTYGPGKGACILRLTLQSVPLETKTQSRTKRANEQDNVDVPPSPPCPPCKEERRERKNRKEERNTTSQPHIARTYAYICGYVIHIYGVYMYLSLCITIGLLVPLGRHDRSRRETRAETLAH